MCCYLPPANSTRPADAKEFSSDLMKKVYEYQNDGDILICVCLFVLKFNVPVNNFSVMSGRSHRFLGN